MARQQRFPDIPGSCELSIEGGVLVLKSPYIHDLVQAVKSLPYAERRYDGSRRVWLIDPKHGKQLVDWIDLYAGEVLSLPKIQAVKTGPVMKLLEVTYIGACKTRDDGSSTAFGLVESDWNVIFPESVLRAWFDSEQTSAEVLETQTLYQVLGTKKAAAPEDIKSAFRRMAMQWHPDHCQEPDANEVFIKIQNAYSILSDTKQRARYDAGLALQATLEKQEKQKRQTGNNVFQILGMAGYRSPLRCGMILLSGFEKVGRIEVTEIHAWEDITKNGKTLVVSWPMGAKKPVEVWA